MRVRIALWCLAACLRIPLAGYAQNPTGTISGRAVDQDGLTLPGVTVSATSPNLQGARTVVTTPNGDFILPLLPPGEYVVTFELSGFQSTRATRSVAGTQTVPLDVTMSVAQVTETITVVGRAEPLVQTAQVATNFKQDLIATLPTNRALEAALLQAPEVHPTGPGGRFSISGSLSYENLVTVNGAVVTENVRSEILPLYIEDAIQETTVSTAGISAEYGRFGGGVVNAITKSGGNIFSGSFRTSFNNDNWRTYTPFETTQRVTNPSLQTKTSKTIPTYEFTLGGPVMRDRLWFFGAGRIQNQQSTLQTAVTNISYTKTDDEKRFEGKLTYSASANHTIKGSYLSSTRERAGTVFQNVMDLAGLTNRSDPQNLVSLHYAGIVTPRLTIEGQYSARRWSIKGNGAQFTDLIRGTLLIDRSRGTNFRYWSPTFCGVCDATMRDNDDIIAKGSYFASSNRYGAHHLVFGMDIFNDKQLSNNHQTGSDYRILGTGTVIQGTTIIPVFQPSSTLIQYFPISLASQGTRFRTYSVFANDNLRYNEHLTFNVGVRWDKNDGKDAARNLVAKDSKFSPRLGLIWDPNADGRWAVTSSFARYVAAVSGTIANVSPAGNPAVFQWTYLGPAINPDPAGPLVSPETAIQRVFDWFFGNGGTDRPFQLADIPGVATQILESLDSPNVNEVAGGVSRQMSNRGSIRADLVFRKYGAFYNNRVDTSTGKVTSSIGQVFDRKLIENTNDVERQYAALSTQATYRLRSRIDLGGNYTVSRARGNFDGETAAGGPGTAYIGYYPEYVQASWNRPTGDLSIDQRHRVRLWGTYTLPIFERTGGVTISILQQISSGVPYGVVGPVDTTPYVANPGYIAPDGGRGDGLWDYYFTARDAFRTDTSYRTDFAVNYSYKVPRAASVEVFFHGEVLNVFNQFQFCGCGDTVFLNGGASDLRKIGTAVRTAANTQTLRPFNPFTETPVQGINWDYGANWQKPTDRFAYTSPFTFRFNVGARF